MGHFFVEKKHIAATFASALIMCINFASFYSFQVAIEFESRAKDPSQNMKKQVPQVCHTLTREIFFTKKPKCSSA